jgi:hypothetical protein
MKITIRDSATVNVGVPSGSKKLISHKSCFQLYKKLTINQRIS